MLGEETDVWSARLIVGRCFDRVDGVEDWETGWMAVRRGGDALKARTAWHDQVGAARADLGAGDVSGLIARSLGRR